MGRRRYGLVLALVVVLLAAGAPSPPAHADNFFGGRVVENTTLYLGVGFPQVEVAAKINVLVPELDIAPRLSLAFGRDIEIACCHVELAGDVRYQILQDGALSGSLMFSLPLGVMTDGGHFTFGVLWPGFALSYLAGADLDIDFGIQLQSTLVFEANTIFQLWADVFVGLSYHATEAISIGFRADVGPDIYAGSVINRGGRIYYDAFVGFNMRFMIAAGFEI